MRRALIVAFVCTLPLQSRADEGDRPVSENLGVELFLSPAHPRAGERVSWLGRVRNLGNRVLLPAGFASWLSVRGHHVAPGSQAPMSGPFTGLGTGEVKWVPFEGGASVELAGDLGDVVPECRGGCPEGALHVSLHFDPTRAPVQGKGVADVPVVPEPLRTSVTLEIPANASQVLERMAPGLVRAQGVGARRTASGVEVRVRLENTSPLPIWVPRPETLRLMGCRVESASGEGGGFGASGFGRPRATRVGDWRLLAPRKSTEGVVICPHGSPSARGGTVSISIVSEGADSYGEGFTPPFVWLGSLELEGIRVK